MPLLKFKCPVCGKVFEELVPMGKTEKNCPNCDALSPRAYEGRCLFGLSASAGGGSSCGCCSGHSCGSACSCGH